MPRRDYIILFSRFITSVSHCATDGKHLLHELTFTTCGDDQPGVYSDAQQPIVCEDAIRPQSPPSGSDGNTNVSLFDV